VGSKLNFATVIFEVKIPGLIAIKTRTGKEGIEITLIDVLGTYAEDMDVRVKFKHFHSPEPGNPHLLVLLDFD
jgi:hypothetical protein